MKYISVLVFFLLFLLVGLRDNIGRDYSIYVYYFKVLASGSINYFRDKIFVYEPCNYFIPVFFKAFVGNDYYIPISIAFFGFLGVLFKLRSFAISNSFFLSILLYLTNYYLLHEMTQIRAGIATGIFLLSIKFIYERQLSKYLLCILAACFFHYSSLLYLPLYLINARQINRQVWLIGLTFFSLLSILKINIFNPAFLSFIPKIEIYLELMEKGDYTVINIWNNFGFIINLGITYILLYKAKILTTKNKYFILLLKLNVISIIIYMAFAVMPVLAVRGSQMIGVVQIVLFPILIYCFKEKVIAYMIIVIISLLYFYNHVIRLDMFKPYYTWIQ